MKIIITIGLILLFCSLLFAAPEISFEKTTHDFGKVKEELGTVEYDFKFTNTGNADLKVIHVKAS